MSPSSEQIEDYFTTYGWQFERRSTDLFRTGFSGDSGHYEIWVRVSDPWVYFTINPFVERREEEPHSDRVLDVMLHFNHDLNMAKFGLDRDGDIALSVEIPAAGFAYSHFADALTALSHYADAYRDKLDDVIDEEENEVV